MHHSRGIEQHGWEDDTPCKRTVGTLNVCCVHKTIRGSATRGENGEVEYCMYDNTHWYARYTVATRATASGNQSLNARQSPTADLYVATGSKTGNIVVTLCVKNH